jgi:hypothetical protein
MTKAIHYDIDGLSLVDIRNRNEPRVIQALREELPKVTGFCGCRLCVEDVYARAMNQITPHYVQTGSIVLQRQPPDDEIRKTVVDALARVKDRPKHPAEPVPLPTSSNF